MMDFERIDTLEKEVKWIHQKFSLIFKMMDEQATLMDDSIKIGLKVLDQNEKLIRRMARIDRKQR